MSKELKSKYEEYTKIDIIHDLLLLHNASQTYIDWCDEISEKLKKTDEILRIIKENCEFDFLKISVNDSVKFEVHIRPKNKDQLLFTCLAIYPKTQFEFDLLKEWLK